MNYTFKPMLVRNTPMQPAQLDRVRGTIAQPKIDGVRMVVWMHDDESITYHTRSGCAISPVLREALDAMLAEMVPGIIFDCELVYRKDCAATTGIIHAKNKGIDPDGLELYCFDVIMGRSDEPLARRLNSLTICERAMVPVPFWTHSSHIDSLERSKLFAERHGLPYEGYVLKPANSMYVQGARLQGSYKFKVCSEVEAVVEGILPQTDPQGNEKTLAGTLVCRIGDTVANVTLAADNMVRAAVWRNAKRIIAERAKVTVRLFDCASGEGNVVRMPRYISGLEGYCNSTVCKLAGGEDGTCS